MWKVKSYITLCTRISVDYKLNLQAQVNFAKFVSKTAKSHKSESANIRKILGLTKVGYVKE
jgi:hypothetical protein